MKSISLTPRMYFDTETTGLDPWHGCKPFIFAFCNDKGVTQSYTLDVDPFTRQPITDTSAAAAKIRYIGELLEQAKTIIMHNAKFDIRMMQLGYGINISYQHGDIEDTMYMAHACRSNELVGLKQLAERYLDYPTYDEKELQDAVLKARRLVKSLKLGWKLGFSEHHRPDGTTKIKAETKADYWLPRAIARDSVASKELSPEERKRWRKLAAIYARGDVERTWLLYHLLREVMTEKGMQTVRNAYAMEMELWPVTYAMETRGVRLDLDELDKLLKQTQAKRIKNLRKVQRKAWAGFNPESNADLIKLCKKLNLPFDDYTPTMQPKVDQWFFLGHTDNSTVKALLRFKSTNKALTSFLLKFRDFGVQETTYKIEHEHLSMEGVVVHPSFRQVGPRTRRFSCADPNLQQTTDDMSARAFEPVQVRACFGPRPGYVWYLLDYSQLEVRIFADGAKEPVMLNALATGDDVHSSVANAAWGGVNNERAITAAVDLLELNRDKAPSSEAIADAVGKFYSVTGGIQAYQAREITKRSIAERWLHQYDYVITEAEAAIGKKATRGRAKALTFLKIFGGGVRAAKRNLQTDSDTAQRFLDDLSDKMPRIDSYIAEMTALARRDGYIINAFDVRISVFRRDAYKGTNVHVQGSAASQLKRAMIACQKYIDEIGLDITIVLCVHDELVFEVRKEHTGRGVIDTLRRIMEDHGGAYSIPTPVNIEKTTTNWANKKEMKGI